MEGPLAVGARGTAFHEYAAIISAKQPVCGHIGDSLAESFLIFAVPSPVTHMHFSSA